MNWLSPKDRAAKIPRLFSRVRLKSWDTSYMVCRIEIKDGVPSLWLSDAENMQDWRYPADLDWIVEHEPPQSAH